MHFAKQSLIWGDLRFATKLTTTIHPQYTCAQCANTFDCFTPKCSPVSAGGPTAGKKWTHVGTEIHVMFTFSTRESPKKRQLS